MVTGLSPTVAYAGTKDSDEIFRLECAILASLPPAAASRAHEEAEWAEECLKDKIPRPARKELNRELGDSCSYEFESFVPTTLRPKAVEECFEDIIEKWSEVPTSTAPLPGEVGLRDCLLAAQKGEEFSADRLNFLAKAKGEEHLRMSRSEHARLSDATRRCRIHPEDGLLEFSVEGGFVPYIPAGICPFKASVTWRRVARAGA